MRYPYLMSAVLLAAVLLATAVFGQSSIVRPDGIAICDLTGTPTFVSYDADIRARNDITSVAYLVPEQRERFMAWYNAQPPVTDLPVPDKIVVYKARDVPAVMVLFVDFIGCLSGKMELRLDEMPNLQPVEYAI